VHKNLSHNSVKADLPQTTWRRSSHSRGIKIYPDLVLQQPGDYT